MRSRLDTATAMLMAAVTALALGPRSAAAHPPIGDVTAYEMKTLASYRCLDADANRPLVTRPIQLWSCNGWPNQRWRFIPLGNPPNGNYLIISKETLDNSLVCLDAQMQSISGNGTKIQLYPCRDGNTDGFAANQVWYNWYANGRQRWVNAHSRRCLDADTNTLNIPNVPTKIQLWDCLNASNQDWRP